jgi:NhaP-type Na+/H+ or K+/H+ antiporter
MQQIDHKVKFFLILALLILVYAFGKVLHLPALVTIFIFGAFLSNVKSLLPPFLRKTLDLKTTEKELHEFHILTAESTFLVRTFFFLFFGFSIQISDFTSPGPLINGLLIFLVMFVLRYVYFTATSLKLKPSPLVYMSPRGLISILLFLQLKEVAFINFEESPIDERMLLIVILSSMLVMLLGTMKKDKKKDIIVEDDETPLSVEMEIEPQSLTEEET